MYFYSWKMCNWQTLSSQMLTFTVLQDQHSLLLYYRKTPFTSHFKMGQWMNCVQVMTQCGFSISSGVSCQHSRTPCMISLLLGRSIMRWSEIYHRLCRKYMLSHFMFISRCTFYYRDYFEQCWHGSAFAP